MNLKSYIMTLLLLSIISFISIVQSQTACGEAADENACTQPALQTTCIWDTGSQQCKCRSEIKQDINFGIDISGSIGWTDFQKEKEFLNELASQNVGSSTRMGFNIFSTHTNISRNLKFWNNSLLVQYVNGIRWTGGYTNTRQYLKDTMQQYADNGSPDRSRIALLVSDGVPCSGNACPEDVCDLAPQLAAANIRVVVVGVGSGWTREYPRNSGITGTKRVECITAPGDVFEVGWNNFTTVLSALSDITCPISKSFQITEIKTAEEGSPKSNRFIEIYNAGVQFQTNDITFTGILVGTPNTNRLVSQSQYVVFYDARSFRPPTNLADVTCQQCISIAAGGACNLTTCTNTSGIVPCYCINSVYIPCGSSVSDQGGYGCYFDTSNDANAITGWNIKVHSGVGTGGLIVDEVVYGASDPVTAPWTPITPGYPYELISKTANNDLGPSWREACDPRGTPGTDPTLDCPDTCTIQSCNPNGGGNTCDQNGSGKCNCVNGTYPDGRTCKPIPGVSGNCTVIWIKNGTTNDQTAFYSWTATDTSLQVKYNLHYRDTTTNNNFNVKDTYQTYFKSDTHLTSGSVNKSYPAYVTLTVSVGGIVYENTFDRILCELLRTSAPSPNPTAWPTIIPTQKPTSNPTVNPTFGCPSIWMTDICSQERCECKGKPNRAITDDMCCFEVDPQKRSSDCDNYKGDELKPIPLDSVLEGGIKQVAVRVYENYPNITCANWTITVESITPGGKIKKLKKGEVAAPTNYTLADVGIEIEPTMGTVCINGTFPKSVDDQTPNEIGFIRFRVIPLNCTCNETEQLNNPSFCNDPAKCFDGWSGQIKLRLNRGNRTLNEPDQCNTTNAGGVSDCCNIIYPVELDFSVTRNEPKNLNPTNEDELPPWLWWLIAALFIFLCLLAFLVYKFWWKAKVVGDSLATTQADLDQAYAVQEQGWAGDIAPGNVGFNPLATGNQNAMGNPGQVGNPNIGNNGPMNDIARVNVDKFQVRQEYQANINK